ncbi:Ergothioneine biosynthesis protein 1 [Vanrija pseudolonga]|uniref:Ergothioneine biosynthesis protein 1 n=1 Tax=Vanrija pseudolonga TaxID=143232 RepID=A0AAF0YG39_9TREE|nr:Ergothioneine biosynthesis protein 1 [Vanrija pseudolonga]
MTKPTVTIHTLPGSTDTDGAGESLRDTIETGLVGGERTVPGERAEDEEWAYTRTVSPLIHYDADGLNYYALDLSKPELERVLGDLDTEYGASLARVSRVGLHADYDAGLKLAKEGKLAALSGGDGARPHHFAFIGTSLGNFSREDAGAFLKSIPLRAGVDRLVLGLDGRPPAGEEGKRKVETAYNDPAGKGRAFEEHGWVVVRRELGLAPDTSIEWANRYNEPLGRHECYYRVKEEQTLHLPNRNVDVHLAKGELLHVEWSIKWSYDEAIALFTGAGLRVVQSWKAPTSEYRVWVLEKAA